MEAVKLVMDVSEEKAAEIIVAESLVVVKLAVV